MEFTSSNVVNNTVLSGCNGFIEGKVFTVEPGFNGHIVCYERKELTMCHERYRQNASMSLAPFCIQIVYATTCKQS